MGCCLKDRDILQLSSWLRRDCHFKLLYKISRDGGSAEKFHELCDNKGPTVTIFYNTDNNVYGGYLSLSWQSSGDWITDTSSFLFQLYSNSKWKPNVFQLKEPGSNAYFDKNTGPKFEDLNSFSGIIEKTSDYYEMSKGDLFCNDYYDTGEDAAKSIANGHNNVTDLEVYLVKGDIYKLKLFLLKKIQYLYPKNYNVNFFRRKFHWNRYFHKPAIYMHKLFKIPYNVHVVMLSLNFISVLFFYFTK